MSPVPEATLEPDEAGGLRPTGPGWFVVNAAEAWAKRHEVAGTFTSFEGDARFEHFGFGIHVLWPGQPNGMYHREAAQEAFLVLDGECLLLVEGQERRLRRWDFFHCPPGTDHIFVGAGDGPCHILMAGARLGEAQGLHYVPDERAARFRASVEQETRSAAEAYAAWPGAFTPDRLPPLP